MSKARAPRFRYGIGASLGTGLALVIVARAVLGWLETGVPLGREVAVTGETAETGLAYTGTIGAAGGYAAPGRALLYVIQLRPAEALSMLHGAFGGLYAFEWLKALIKTHRPPRSVETWIALGPGQAPLGEIRQMGNGRYTITGDQVFFSLPEGVDLGDARLELVLPLIVPQALAALARALSWITILFAAAVLLALLWPALRRLNRASALARNLLPGIAVSAALLLATGGAAELYFRAVGEFPRDHIKAPIRFVSDVGFLYQPGAEIRWTNGLDFWTDQRANSLGFADREPAIPKPPGTFRILLVGDSFVEALQVPLEKKLQTRLIGLLSRRFPDRRVDAVAMGFMGTGQSNQLAYIEKFGELVKPDLVILLVVDNDFANNSVVLESVRRGWGPEYPPLLFFRTDSDGLCRRIEISPQWEAHQLRAETAVERMAMLRGMSPDYARDVRGWDPETIDFEFFSAAKLPAVFEQAVVQTRCAYAAWKQRAAADWFRVVVVATDDVTDGAGKPQSGQIDRLKTIARDLDLPLLDLYPIFTARGGTALAHWQHDGHWNVTGHERAAEAIADFLDKGGYLRPD